MGGGKSLFHRFALKQKVALIRKTKAVKTLQDELDRAATVRNQLKSLEQRDKSHYTWRQQ